MKRLLLCMTILLAVVAAQNYQWPIDASKSLKSNFGEFRDRHFHMGIDIKTG